MLTAYMEAEMSAKELGMLIYRTRRDKGYDLEEMSVITGLTVDEVRNLEAGMTAITSLYRRALGALGADIKPREHSDPL